MPSLIPTDGTNPWGAAFRTLWEIAHNDDGTAVASSQALDTLGATTDVTTLNSSTSKHGLLPKLDGNTAHFLNGNGAWTTPAGGGGGGSLTWPATWMRYFVDYQNGSDSNVGNGPGASDAYKTLQAAYNAAQTYAKANYSDSGKGLAVGLITMAPGNHDVGTGVTFDALNPVKVVGDRLGSVTHFPSLTAPTIVSSSSSATEMIRIVHSANKGYGFEFRDLAFRMNHTTNSSMTKILYGTSLGNWVVDHCSFDTDDNNTNVSVTAVYHEDLPSSAGEGGWVRVTNNNVSRMQLYQAATTTGAAGGNFNRGRISDNVMFYGGSLPMIQFNANVGGYLVDGNNLEGTATGVSIGGNGVYLQNTFINNSGEDDSSGTPPNSFYDLTGSVSQQIIIGGYCICPSASGAGKWVNFSSNAYRNYVLGVFDLTGVTNGYKRWVNDAGTDKNFLLLLNMVTPAYTVTNPTTDRGLNVTGDTLAQVAEVLGTLIADMQTRGNIK